MLLTLLVDPLIRIVFSFPSKAIADSTQKSSFSGGSVFDPFGGRIYMSSHLFTDFSNDIKHTG